MEKLILDMTCGGKSIWFDKENPYTVFFDKRDEEHEGVFVSNPATRHIKVHPDVMGDFTNLPFPDNSFSLVVFDPPHIVSPNGDNRWLTKAYGYYTTKDEALESVRGV